MQARETSNLRKAQVTAMHKRGSRSIPEGSSMAQQVEMARNLRLDVLEMTCRWGGHLSSCYSAVEIMTVLYFGGILRYRPDEPHWPERDRFFLSKGHAAPLLYSVLARAGYYGLDELKRFRQVNSPYHGHPIQDSPPGVENTSGSLGHGISHAIGHALSGRLDGLNYRCYVLVGDGECQEGQIWEAAMSASHYQADGIVAIVNYNEYQQNGSIESIVTLEPFAAKWKSFGWHTVECDGHDIATLTKAIREAGAVTGQPSVVIAHTVKGKGISFVEADYTFHGRELNAEEEQRAKEELCA